MVQFTFMPKVGWIVGSAAFVGALLLLSYTLAKGRATRWLRFALAGLRWIIISAVAICLLDPQWVEAIKHQQKSRFAILLDASKSMGTKDVPQDRLQAATEWIKIQAGTLASADMIIERYSFSQSLQQLDSFDAAKPEGDATALADALENLLAVPRDDPLAGVLVCSDGIENVQRDPVAVAKLYHRKGIPIHSLTVGTTNDVQDIILENVQVKRAVPNQSPTKVELAVRSYGYRGLSVPVQILSGTRVVGTHQMTLKDGAQSVEIEFTPRQRGFQVFEVRIPVQRGEWLATNNRRMFGLEVIDPTIRVIYMEGTPQQPGSPIPEWKYLKDALESDPNIKVKTLYRQFGNNGQFLNTVDADPETGERIYPVEHPTKGFPHTMSELLNYDVIIHSDIRTDSFTSEQLENMARLVEEYGGGFVMIGGNSAFGKGGYHRTILDRIIPVAMERENDSLARQISFHVPTAAYNHPIMALGTTREETELIWAKFPVLYGCNLVDRAKPGATVLGVDATARNQFGPRLLMAVENIGKGRSMAFTSDTTRSWGKDFETIWGEPINASLPLRERNCDSRYYRQFWVNAVRWLAAARIGRTNSPVTLELAQSYSSPKEKVAASVKVRDKEGRPVEGAEVALALAAGRNTNMWVKAAFDRVTQSYLADLSPTAAGNFTVIASAKIKEKILGDDRQLLVCEAIDREMADLRARPETMANLSRVSGGNSFTLDPSDGTRLSSLLPSSEPIATGYRRSPVWDKWWWLTAILTLLAVEWGTRRLNGMA
jgi:uncharacterized membrane protein